MTREESSDALNLILTGIPSPTQIGAFMIAHRIRRPEPQELAGMVDTYLKLGPNLQSKNSQKRPICFGMPFDGRTRTAPIYPVTALVLVSAGQPVVLQGGRRMPIKYGVTSSELLADINLNLIDLTINQVQKCLCENDIGFIYQPKHFPLAENLIYYREEIGKRPTIASMELLWTAHQSKHLFVTGFVHSPTEERHWQTLELLGEKEIITVKGLEGGTDIPSSKLCIANKLDNNRVKRIELSPKDFNLYGKDQRFTSREEWGQWAIAAINYQGPLLNAVVWNAGFYLWVSGITETLENGIEKADRLLKSGKVQNTLNKIIKWKANL